MSRKLQAIKTSDCGQYRIENIDDDELYESSPWSDYYVSISGYCGDVGPHVFAAAPELLEALEDAMDSLKFAIDEIKAQACIPDEDSEMMNDRYERGMAAIAKAKGETK